MRIRLLCGLVVLVALSGCTPLGIVGGAAVGAAKVTVGAVDLLI